MNGHVSCSTASFLQNYMKGRVELKNTYSSAAESCNHGLNRIRKSISYMGEKRAIVLAFVYLNVWNRKVLRDIQTKKAAELRRLEG